MSRMWVLVVSGKKVSYGKRRLNCIAGPFGNAGG